MKPQALFIAQPAYTAVINGEKVWEDLPRAAEAASALAEQLASHGFELGHQDLLKGGETRDVVERLDNWFVDVAGSPSLILFWTGHGCSDGGKYYLICRSSPKNGVSGLNSIDTSAIGAVLANSKAEKILVVLDTCYSGLGAGEIAESLGRILATRQQVAGQQRAFAIIASAHPLEEAKEAVFSNALRTALFEFNLTPGTREWTDNDEFIHTDALCTTSIRLMADDASPPQYVAYGAGQRFVRNPRFQANSSAQNVEERLWRLSCSDAGEHFQLAARGIEVGETHWFFSGRRRLLRRLVDWLTTAEHGVRIVTGPPGTGKSAVMGHIATLSDAQYRQEAITAGAVKEEEDAIPPVGAIDVAVHAKGKTLDDCARALAKGLGVEIGQDVSVDIKCLVANISKLDRKITLMVDALDEAAGGHGVAIASSLIVPLGRLPHVRILVGTRRSLDGVDVPEGEARHGRLRAAFGENAIIDDLEDESDTLGDIASYVQLRLSTSEKHRDDSVESIDAVAQRVAASAKGIFLYARIVSRTLQEQDQLDGHLPETALEAFELDIRVRFHGEECRVNDLLGALAWGEGKGLTRRVWPLLANSIVGREHPYNDDDIGWVLGKAGWHIIEAGEDGQAVYRLAHQTLADHYRGKFDEKETQMRIVTALPHGIAGAGWLDCDHYLWRHLAEHAAKAECLDDLVRDPGYLAVADPTRLVLSLPRVKSAEGRRFADIYNRVVDRLVDQSPVDRMPMIHMTAQMEDPELAPRLEPPVAAAWRCAWARVRSSVPYRVIGKHDRPVTSIAVGMIDDALVIVSGSEDRTIRRWDARRGEPIGKPLEGHTASVTSVAFGAIDGRPAVVSGSNDNTIRRWDARTGEPIGEPLKGHSNWVTSIALGAIDGAPVIASKSEDGTIRRWEARTGEPIGEPLEGGVSASIAFGAIDGACGGPIFRKRMVGRGRWVFQLSQIALQRWWPVGALWNRSVIVSGDDGTIRLWDARTGELIREPLYYANWIRSVALGAIDGAPIVVSGGLDGTVRRWNARTVEPIGEPLKGHTSVVNSVTLGAVDGAPVIVSGGLDGTVRRWNARTGEPIGEPLEGHTSVSSVALGAIDGAPVIVSGGDEGTIRCWDVRKRVPIGEPLEGHTDLVSVVALGAIDGAPVIVSREDLTIRCSNARTGAPIGEPLEVHLDWSTSVALGAIDGAPILVLGARNGTIRCWNARTGEIGEELKGNTGWLSVVALGAIDGAPVIVSGGYEHPILRWNARTGEPIGEPLKGEAADSIALGAIDGAPVIVSGHGDAVLRWDARAGEPIGEPLEGHTNSVRAVALGAIDGAPVIVSGSDDGTIRRWNMHAGMSGLCLAIMIGEPVKAILVDDSMGVVVGLNRGIVVLELLAMQQK